MITNKLTPNLTPDKFVELADHLSGAVIALVGSMESRYGCGIGLGVAIEDDYGVSKAVRLYEAAINATGQYPIISRMSANAHELTHKAGNQMPINFLHRLLQDLSVTCASVDLDPKPMNVAGFATYYNTGAGGPYKALVSAEFANLFKSLYKVDFGASNTYSPAIPKMAEKSFNGRIFPVASVHADTYAGVSLRGIVVDYIGETGVMTVTGTARDTQGNLVNSHSWSAEIIGNGSFDLIPDRNGYLCLEIDAIGFPATATGGTIIIEGRLPARLCQ